MGRIPGQAPQVLRALRARGQGVDDGFEHVTGSIGVRGQKVVIGLEGRAAPAGDGLFMRGQFS